MGYSDPRRRREQRPDVRDILEDAAEEAGLSVEELIDEALAEDRRSRRGGPRHLRLVERDDERPLEALERRLNRAGGRRRDALSEDRVAAILERAFDEIRESERRTADLIGSLAEDRERRRDAVDRDRSAPRPQAAADNVVSIHGRAPQAAAPGLAEAMSRLDRDLARQEVERTLETLERKLAAIQPADPQDEAALRGMVDELASIRAVAMAPGAHVPLAAIERPILSLTERITAMAAQAARAEARRPAAPQASPRDAASAQDIAAMDRRLNDVEATTAAMVAGIQDELVRLGRSGLNRNDAAVQASFDRLDARIQQLESAARRPLEEIRQRLDLMQVSTPAVRQDDGLRRSVEALSQKLDMLGARMAQPLQMVHNAVTQMQRHRASAAGDEARLDALFKELAALKRGIHEQALPVAGAAAQMQRQIAAIAAKVEAIVHRMQQEQTEERRDAERRDADRRSLEEELAEIKALLREAAAPCDDSRVLDAVSQLERKIAALENSPQVLLERLDRLQARIEEKPAGGGQTLPPNIELLLRNLALRLETAPTPSADPADEAAFARLHEELRLLSGKLESLARPVAPASGDLSGVQHAVGELFQRIDALSDDLGERAARAAAEAVRALEPPPMPLPPPAPSLDPAAIEASLEAMRRAQAEAEDRNTRTLEALHDTLERVVDRLKAMETGAARPSAPLPSAPMPAAPSPLAPQPAAPAAPMDAPAFAAPPPAAPAMSAPSNLASAQGQRPFEPTGFPPAPADQPPAAASSFRDTLAQLRGQTPPRAPTPEPAADGRSKVAAALDAAREAMEGLRLGRAAAEGPDAPARPAPPASGAKPAAPPVRTADDLDILLEPGSGRPRPVHQQPPGAAAPTSQAGPQPVGGDAKADFLAAARRAAQAAAQQSAQALSEQPPKTGVRGKLAQMLGRDAPTQAARSAPEPRREAESKAAGAGFRARHAILLGLAALIVAAGAGYQFLGGGQRVEAPPPAPPARTSMVAPPAPDRPPTPTPAARPSERETSAAPVRQIIPPPIAEARPPAPPAAAAPAPTADRDAQMTVGALPTPERVPSAATRGLDPDHPLLRFEGLKDAPRLREAARRGDVAAFVELGHRYADGRGAARDPKLAAEWLKLAAAQGSALAHYRLGALHREGRGVERNPKQALRHFEAAAEAGNARGMHNAAVLLAEGVNGAPDYAAAAEWFRKAAEFGIRDSQYNLAILHARGLGVPQDLAASYAWFAAAASGGDQEALKKRDEVGSRLPADRLRQAQAAAQQWRPKTPDPAANEIVGPPGGWDQEAKPPSAPAGGARPSPQRRT